MIIYQLPQGEKVSSVSGARQPTFRSDGRMLLVNAEGAGKENAWEIDTSNWQFTNQVSGSPADNHPFYNPQSNRIVYDNSTLYGYSDTFIYIQCSLVGPQFDIQEHCREHSDIALLTGEGNVRAAGSHPVWTINDYIAYKGCDVWMSGNHSCGIFIVESWATISSGGGITPRKLPGVNGGSATPTDTHGTYILYQAFETGNWEVYLTTLQGGETNLSNNPTTDGLPTFSPDGLLVAFVSDRGGQWGVWVMPRQGGVATKMFDLPPNPWGTGHRDWTNERMSWGH
ncbi:MAG: hypothetical protein B6242_12245 [Anaerolineaceae bacterium 4572_78]|nr:MAG: hypothetical protein B6242_12245 [Anaerolineaceae bacterium 4572_78]